MAGWEVLPLQSQSGVNMLCIRDKHTGKAYIQQNLVCVCVPHAAAALFRKLHPLIRQHVVEMVANIVEDGMLCTQSRSTLKSAQRTVQHSC